MTIQWNEMSEVQPEDNQFCLFLPKDRDSLQPSIGYYKKETDDDHWPSFYVTEDGGHECTIFNERSWVWTEINTPTNSQNQEQKEAQVEDKKKFSYIVSVGGNPLAVYDTKEDAETVKTKLKKEGHRLVEVAMILDTREHLQLKEI